MPSNLPVIDFLILDTHNKKTLGIGDLSYYPTKFIIQNPTYEITPPSFPKINISFTARNFMLLNSNDVGITCQVEECFLSDLPDGIWKIKASITPPSTYNKEKSFMRVDVINEKFGRALLMTDLAECNSNINSKDKANLDMADAYIQGAIAEANRCNDRKALEYYDTANKILDDLINRKC